MKKVVEIIKRKPALFLVASLGYLLIVGFLKWNTHPSIDTALFLLGGVIGVYFLDIAEVFFHLVPSPFRSILFVAGFFVVSLFIVTSSGSFLANGLVLSLYLTLVLWQVGEWYVRKNLDEWYRMIQTPVALNVQQIILVAFVLLFIAETYMFIK